MVAAELRSAGGGEGEPVRRRLSMALHELCQPLTALQFLLEIAKMPGDGDATRDVLDAGLAECVRMNALVENMRSALRQNADGTAR